MPWINSSGLGLIRAVCTDNSAVPDVDPEMVEETLEAFHRFDLEAHTLAQFPWLAGAAATTEEEKLTKGNWTNLDSGTALWTFLEDMNHNSILLPSWPNYTDSVPRWLRITRTGLQFNFLLLILPR